MIIKHPKDIMMIDNCEHAFLINTNSETVKYIPENRTVVKGKDNRMYLFWNCKNYFIFRSNQYIWLYKLVFKMNNWTTHQCSRTEKREHYSSLIQKLSHWKLERSFLSFKIFDLQQLSQLIHGRFICIDFSWQRKRKRWLQHFSYSRVRLSEFRTSIPELEI